MDSFALVFQNCLSQYAADIRQLEKRIIDLEAEIVELKRPKTKPHQTTLENLILKGATYEPANRRSYQLTGRNP
jgi:hypothetical protein